LKLTRKILRQRESICISPFQILTLLFIIFTLILGVTESSAWMTEHGTGPGGYVFPPNLVKEGISFANSRIPIERPGVHERIIDQLNYLLMDRRASLGEWFNRFVLYGPSLVEGLKKNNVPFDFVYLSMLLSELDPDHKTRSGGLGWWALGPSRDSSVKDNVPWLSTPYWDDRRDPEVSTQIASQMFQNLHNKNPKLDWLLLIAGFIDGNDKLEPILKKSPGFGFWDIVTPPSSDSLIPRLVALKIIHRYKSFYCVTVTQDKPLAFDNLGRVKLVKDFPLSNLAKWTGRIPRDIWGLNPGVDIMSGLLPKADKRAPDGFPLRVPSGTGPKIKNLLESEGYLLK
jgi:membrane-bound lytic murein transglycosylase D